MNQYFVYILANRRGGTLYTGVTSNLLKRVCEHKNDLVDGFTKKYGVHRLVYFEDTSEVMAALEREKQLKRWRRRWKIELIEHINPKWDDLYDGLLN